MKFDFPTLTAVLSFVTTLMGLLSFYAWTAKRQDAFLSSLTCAFLVGAAGILVVDLRAIIPFSLSIGAGYALVLLSYGLLWKAVRGFEGRTLRPAGVVMPAALWLAVYLCLPSPGARAAKIALLASLSGLYAFLVVSELWRGRREPLRSRWIAIVVGSLHALYMLVRAVLVRDLPFPLGVQPENLSWAAVIPIEGMTYAMLTMCSLLLMHRERAELQQHRAAQLDPLTGIANRRAFIKAAESVWGRKSLQKESCVAILMFDLDRFKQINDTFGHNVGDDVLILFARTASAILGDKTVFARLGGEEFAAIFECTGPDQAYKVAERVRTAYAEAAVCVTAPTLKSTVSIGASVIDRRVSLSAVLASADQALYRAKQRGRNRVEWQHAYSLHPEWNATASAAATPFGSASA